MSDEQIQTQIRRERQARKTMQTVEELDASVEFENALRDEIATRFPIGKCGHEGLPDQA